MEEDGKKREREKGMVPVARGAILLGAYLVDVKISAPQPSLKGETPLLCSRIVTSKQLQTLAQGLPLMKERPHPRVRLSQGCLVRWLSGGRDGGGN